MEHNTISAASGYSFLFFLAWCWLTYWAWKEDELIPNTTQVSCKIFGFSDWFNDLQSTPWCSQSCGCKPILKYISAMSHTRATGYLLNLNNTSTRSCCNFGPGWITLFNDFPSYLAVPSNNILIFVVDLPGRITGKWGKYQQSLLSFLAFSYSRYPFLIYYSIISQYFSPSSGYFINLLSVLSSRFKAIW